MTIDEAFKILELNVICSPRATQFKEAVEVITSEVNRQKAEIERLKEHIKHTNNVVKQVVEDTRSEAIKEFAERLKEKAFKPLGTWFNEKVVTENRIDNLVKEMTEKE